MRLQFEYKWTDNMSH